MKIVNFFLIIFCCFFTSVYGLTIGIAGASGSGKTTLACQIKSRNPELFTILSLDNYYKDFNNFSSEERSKINFDDPQAIDVELLKQHILKLQNGESVLMPIYDFSQNTRSGRFETLYPSEFLIVEGFLLFAITDLLDLFEIRIFTELDLDLCVIRMIERNLIERKQYPNHLVEHYAAHIKPSLEKFILPSRREAHIIVPTNKETCVFVDCLMAFLKNLDFK